MLNSYCNIFGFLASTEEMKRLVNSKLLQKSCDDLQIGLMDLETNTSDIDAHNLNSEIETLLRMEMEKNMNSYEILSYITTNLLLELFPNLVVALRIVLTLPVSVASAERSFSKLKLIKTYLRSIMSQERLTGLALISVEHQLSSSLNYSKLIQDFAAAKVRKVDL